MGDWTCIQKLVRSLFKPKDNMDVTGLRSQDMKLLDRFPLVTEARIQCSLLPSGFLVLEKLFCRFSGQRRVRPSRPPFALSRAPAALC